MYPYELVSSMKLELSHAAFAGLRGTTFLVSRDGMEPVELELVEVEDLRDPNRSLPSHIRQDPFQLLLRGPIEPLLPQNTYTFAAGGVGELQLFLVPTGPRDGSHWYDVVVN
jgi:hypothetical protein